MPASAIHIIHEGNLPAEADALTGQTLREYVWFAGRPISMGTDVAAANPTVMAVHVDHLDRPVAMTDAAGMTVWRAYYKPFGEVQSVTGPASLDARFPGQWFMAEAGLAYNWHRWYDASLGRYTQPDPLGLVDGPSRYAYARNSPLVYVDPDGQQSGVAPGISPMPFPPVAIPGTPENKAWTKWVTRSCQAATDYLTNLLSPPESQEGCDEEWEEARERCAAELRKPNPNRRITGGYRNIDQCARGLVSERCGGNPVTTGYK